MTKLTKRGRNALDNSLRLESVKKHIAAVDNYITEILKKDLEDFKDTVVINIEIKTIKDVGLIGNHVRHQVVSLFIEGAPIIGGYTTLVEFLKTKHPYILIVNGKRLTKEEFAKGVDQSLRDLILDTTTIEVKARRKKKVVEIHSNTIQPSDLI